MALYLGLFARSSLKWKTLCLTGESDRGLVGVGGDPEGRFGGGAGK